MSSELLVQLSGDEQRLATQLGVFGLRGDPLVLLGCARQFPSSR